MVNPTADKGKEAVLSPTGKEAATVDNGKAAVMEADEKKKKKIKTEMKVVFLVEGEKKDKFGWCTVDESGLLLSSNEKEDDKSWIARNDTLQQHEIKIDDDDDVEKEATTGLILEPDFSIPYPINRRQTRYGFRFAVVNSVFVIAGGVTPGESAGHQQSNRFAYLETKTKSWVDLFGYGLFNPKLIVSRRKLFMFDSDMMVDWQAPGIFDPKSKSLSLPYGDWPNFDNEEELNELPKDVVASPDNRTILVFAVPPFPQISKVLQFDTKTESWLNSISSGPRFPPEFIHTLNLTNLLLVNTTLYWLSPTTLVLHAYEINNGYCHYYSKPIYDSVPMMTRVMHHMPTVIDQGACFRNISPEIFCLVWRDSSIGGEFDGTKPTCHCRFHVTKLHISKIRKGGKGKGKGKSKDVGSGGSLKVSVVSDHTYLLLYPMDVSYVDLM